MVILQVSPESPALIQGAAATLLYLHIGGGIVGLLSGAAALALRKGSRPHRMAGNVFFVSMLIMAAIGAGVLHLPVLLVIILAIFWTCRARFTRAYGWAMNDRQGFDGSLASP